MATMSIVFSLFAVAALALRGCPGGSWESCTSLCPLSPPVAHKTCVLVCTNDCASSQVSVSIETSKLVSTTSPTFVSFGWEMDGMIECLPYLSDTRFRTIASHLSPATIRVGGITGDFVKYTQIPSSNKSDHSGNTANAASVLPHTRTKSKKAARSMPSKSLGSWPTAEKNLSMPMFSQLTDFMAASNLSLMFMLNELHGRDCHTIKPGPPPVYGPKNAWCSGEWDTSNMKAFLQHLHDTKQVGGKAPTYAFELGNELITHMTAATNAEDIKRAAGIIQSIWADVPADQRPGLYAPSTDACWSDDQMQIMRNITGVPGVAGFTFHAYPGGGTYPGGPPYNLTKLILDPDWLGNLFNAPKQPSQNCLDAWNRNTTSTHPSHNTTSTHPSPRASGLQLLLTESSSSYSWNLPPPAQDSFLHTLFTVAELGQYARSGVGFVARWAFSEGTPFATIKIMGATDTGEGAAGTREETGTRGETGKRDAPGTREEAGTDAIRGAAGTGAIREEGGTGVIKGAAGTDAIKGAAGTRGAGTGGEAGTGAAGTDAIRGAAGTGAISFDVAADYWVILAHKRSVGSGVLSTTMATQNSNEVRRQHDQHTNNTHPQYD